MTLQNKPLPAAGPAPAFSGPAPILSDSAHAQTSSAAVGHLPNLTPRERQVLALAVDYYRARDIAQRLYMSESLVSLYLKSIRRKFGAISTGEMLRRARNAGIGT